MGWIESIGEAISYIEENITEELSIEDIAKHACISSFYFQKGFAMLCGFTVSEYIRKRRLSLAGNDLIQSDQKIIDIALKYGYDSPDSFTKAFIRFHGVTPTAVRKEGAMIKSYAPLKINFLLKGGYRINMDLEMGRSQFEYMIADNYNPSMEVPEGFITRVIPKHTWAVFPCVGPSAKSIQEINQKIFSEWLPNCKNYEIAEGYNIEMYTDVRNYPNGLQDEKYYSEIWIPVKKK